MAPPTIPFHPTQLPQKINYLPNGKPRKPDQRQNLDDCVLKEMTQWNCQIQYEDSKDRVGVIVCGPVLRLFRRCADGLTVETTSWE